VSAQGRQALPLSLHQPNTSAFLPPTPHHTCKRRSSRRGALEGERKQITILFADLKGSMELLADPRPEDARDLDPVLTRMMEAALLRRDGESGDG
jgi:class 3 adenylate cyclase